MAIGRRYIDNYMPVRVKICGITNREDAEAAVAAGADALGFILYPKSKRFISIEDAIRIVEGLPPFVQTVAVTVNAVKEFTNLGWRKQLKNFGIAQLHGQESPAHVKAVSKYLPVIKVFPADRAREEPRRKTPGGLSGDGVYAGHALAGARRNGARVRLEPGGGFQEADPETADFVGRTESRKCCEGD